MVIWKVLFYMMEEEKVPADCFMEVCLKAMDKEVNDMVFELVVKKGIDCAMWRFEEREADGYMERLFDVL